MEEVAKRRRSDGEIVLEKGEETLDAELWGKLQDYIPLHIVYEKLPLEDRLRLRVVCKAWNLSALERVEPKPYFVTIALGYTQGPDVTYLNGLVKYDGEFSFELQPFRLYRGRECEYECRRGFALVLPLEVEGLIICCHPYDSDQQGVYNVHTKTWHAVPPAPETSDFSSICGMMVDTSERPYVFRLVVGSVDKKTQIYDSKSRSWSTTSSIMVESALRSLNQSLTFSCMCYNGCVYMSVGRSNAQMILVYSMDEDSWTTLDFPFASGDDHNTLGVWEGRIFTVREDRRNHKITVWELVDVKKQEWVEYARCPEEEYDRLLLYTTDLSYLAYEDKDLVSVFCDEYLLIYNWHYRGNQAYELLMFNLETKKWIPVGLPRGTVSTGVDEDGEFSDEDDEFLDEEIEVDDVDDVDEVDEFDEVDEVDGDGDFDHVEEVEDED
jgi:F-box interacting protein